MNKSILILEENSMIHGLIASALDLDGLTLHHEFDPGEYVGRAKTLMPDLILLSNADQARDYSVCRELRRDEGFRKVPVVLLAGSKDRIQSQQLSDLSVAGVIRKPFEASDLQQQVSKHLDLVDLIGSAYDYKKSQSLRDEGMGPLADMEVLDQEILGFLHDSAGSDEGSAVPGVDFSRELAGESRSAAPMVEESTLEESLEPERAFEPVPPRPAPARITQRPAAAPDRPSAAPRMEGAALTGMTSAPGPAPEGDALEELGAQDVLDEGADEEARWAPAGFDQSFSEDDSPGEARQGRVEMELAGADVDFDAAAEEMDEGEVELFESDFGKGGRAGRPAEDESIPEAVRRMVEMKPVLTMSKDAAGTRAGAVPEIAITPDDAELTAMAQELDQMDEFQVREAFVEPAKASAPAEPAAPANDWQLAGAANQAVEGEADEEFFHEDYLGDEEIDEEKIHSALVSEMDSEPEFEVILDDSDDFEGDALEDSEMKEIEALGNVELDFGAEEDEEDEIIIDPDEESMVLASLEQDEALDAEVKAASPMRAAASPGPRLESASESMEPVPGSANAGTAEDLLDRQLDALEESAEDFDSGMEEEPDIRRAPPAVEVAPSEESAESWDFGSAEEKDLASEPFIADEAREMAAFAAALDAPPEEALEGFPESPDAGTVFDSPAELSGFQEPAEFIEEEVPISELDEVDMPNEIQPPMVAAVPAKPASQKTSGGSDFDSVLAELQREIEANPVGERLDDVLAKEGIVEAVEAVEFSIPQHEHPFTRAMGVLDMPGAGSVSEEMTRSVTAKVMPAAVAAASSAVAGMNRSAALSMEGLHEGVVARLSEVLDEVIRDTVRRVVREEVPEFMDRMRREESGHGR